MVLGARLWSANIGGDSPAAIVDGVVYVSGDKLYVFDAATGSRRWSVTSCCGAPVVGERRGLHRFERLAAFDAATGQSLWALDERGTAPVVANGVVYFGDSAISAFSLPIHRAATHHLDGVSR